MGTKTTNLSIRMNAELKEKAEKLFKDLGLNISTACNMFFVQAVNQGRIPFEVINYVPNSETIEAMEEAEKISRDPKAKRYSSFSELLEEVKNEV